MPRGTRYTGRQMRQRYTVRAAPNMSGDEGITYFTIDGPDVNRIAVMKRIALLLETVLNATDNYVNDMMGNI